MNIKHRFNAEYFRQYHLKLCIIAKQQFFIVLVVPDEKVELNFIILFIYD